MKRRSDHGFTLIEMLVAMTLSSVLGSLVLGVSLGLRHDADAVHASSDLQDAVRLATERIVRELRQAGTIDKVDLPQGVNDPTAITFWADFNGNGVRDLDATDPEVLTYRLVPGTGQLTLTVDDAGGNAVTTPILATNVTAFGIDLHSSLWQYDRNGDGIVTWQELDTASGIGNNNGKPDGRELPLLDSVIVAITVRDGTHSQIYRTQVDFRNQQQN
jgi:prepilin-type N-terminal cleavage/methylation domain-containing protein